MSKDQDFLHSIIDNGELIDIEAQKNGRAIRLLGPGGIQREIAPIEDFLQNNPNKLPVLLGPGLGAGLKKLLDAYQGDVAVIDFNNETEDLTQTIRQLTADQQKRLFIINDPDPKHVLDKLTIWQGQLSGKPFHPIVFSFYQRWNNVYYGEIRKSLDASSAFDFWGKVAAPRFQNKKPRVLLLASKYFLMGEIERACRKLDIPYKLIRTGEESADGQEFVKKLLDAAINFKPDCAITLNHMGVDREGLLMDLLARLQLPLASWFVDNPHLIIHLYSKCVSPWTALFTWDEDNIKSLQKFGFEHVHYLPLGTDPDRFYPGNKNGKPEWRSQISFVGNSMIYKVGHRLKAGHFPKQLLLVYRQIASAFSDSGERDVATFIKNSFPEAYQHYAALPDNEDRLAYETAITWQATRLYRNNCVRQLLPFKPLIVGDNAWKIEFRHDTPQPRYLDAISYYDQLPAFYGMSDINFNCTSKQMKGAVNQRIFDAPAANAFVLTDWRPQITNLFEPDEIACYQEPGEIAELCQFYLNHPKDRAKIAAKGRKRVLAQHKWEDRLKTLLDRMSAIYGTPVTA